jgi:type I restriction enzyme S subunit
MTSSTDSIYGVLPESWKLVSLNNLIENKQANLQTGPFGTMLHASAYTATGIPVVAVKNIGDNQVVHSNIPFVDSETYQRLKRYELKVGDILFGRKGSVDRRAFIRIGEDGWLQGSDCIRLRFKDSQINAAFISYVLGTRQYIEWITQNAQGATMPSLNQEILGRIPIPLPPLPEQCAIADVLGSLEDKIELNRRMNTTLESMARAVFRQWFVESEEAKGQRAGSILEFAELLSLCSKIS